MEALITVTVVEMVGFVFYTHLYNLNSLWGKKVPFSRSTLRFENKKQKIGSPTWQGCITPQNRSLEFPRMGWSCSKSPSSKTCDPTNVHHQSWCTLATAFLFLPCLFLIICVSQGLPLPYVCLPFLSPFLSLLFSSSPTPACLSLIDRSSGYPSRYCTQIPFEPFPCPLASRSRFYKWENRNLEKWK